MGSAEEPPDQTAEPRRRIGRRPGESRTREDILDAARGRFTAQGFDGATIRGIALDAGVDPALVHHYFGTKEHLFAAALQLPVNPAEVIPDLIAPGIDGAGDRLARFLFGELLAEREHNPVVAMIRSVSSHEDAARMFREFYTSAVLVRVASLLDRPQPELRAALCGSQLIGAVVARDIIAFRPLTQAGTEVLIAAYGPVFQHFLTMELPTPSGS